MTPIPADRVTVWTEWRRHLHTCPELGFDEQRTAAFVAEKLGEFGWEVVTGVGGTGVVATLAGPPGSPAIGLRADMDALPITEKSAVAHQSRTSGRMHACGHDGHMAMLLGAAEMLTRHPLPVTARMIFQPAEEGGGGGNAMLADGLFERWPVDEIFAIHNYPGLPLGSFSAVIGPSMASYDEFSMVFEGRGGHAAFPHQADDVVLAAAQSVVTMQAIVSRAIDPMHAVVVSATKLDAGTARNVMPSTATVEGSIRSFDPADRDRIAEILRRMATSVGDCHGVTAHLTVSRLYAPTINTKGPTERARRVITETFGADRLADIGPQPASDDFGAMLGHRPGCYVVLGTGDDDHQVPVHHPEYDFNDRAIASGVEFWVALAEQFAADAPHS